MGRLESVVHLPAAVVWVEALMGCIETGMASEVKALLREKAEDRHEIVSKSLAVEFQNPSPGWKAQAGLLDTQQPKLKNVWWVFYLDKQLCNKAMNYMTLPPCVPLPAPVVDRPAEVAWIEALMECIETGMAAEVKALLREKTEDRHEFFSRSLAEAFHNPSPDWIAQAGLIDTQQPRRSAVWWVFYLDKQLCDKAKEAITFPTWNPLPASAAALPYWEQWADAKAKVDVSDGKQEAWKRGDSWIGCDSWTGDDSWSGGWSS